MMRIHGDLHLGQVLVASGEAYIIDFEGEPMASIAERRAKTSPLRDVAGLLRSIDYAGATLMDRDNIGAAPVDEARRDEFIALFRQRAAIAFLRSYWRAGALKDTPATRALLDLFLIEKAAYEIAYEAANRPSWIGVPLAGLARLLDAHSRQGGADWPWLRRSSRPRGDSTPRPPARSRTALTTIRSPCSGRTMTATGRIIRAFLPGALKVDVLRRRRQRHGAARAIE